MANVQVEYGAIAVAQDLFLAMQRYDFTSLELRVICAVIFLTYGNSKTKAEMSIEDIRYTLGADEKLRTDRLEMTLTKLLSINVLFRQELSNGKQIIGLQKDYDKWGDKMSATLQGISINNINKLPSIVPDKMSTPVRLLEYALRASSLKLNQGAWRAERKQAKRLYLDAIRLTGSPALAEQAIYDFIDTNSFMRENVKHQFTFMNTWFEKWYKSIPRKTKQQLEDEEITGKRYRWNAKTKQWEAVNGN